jgi:hypothetical protein
MNPAPIQFPIFTKDLKSAIDSQVWIQWLNNLTKMGSIKARAYRNTDQNTGTGGNPVKVQIDVTSFDTNGVIDLINNRIIPNLSGYYIVNGNVRVNEVTAQNRIISMIYKNGSNITQGSNGFQDVTSTGDPGSVVSDLVYLNGTTDYVELWVYSSNNAIPLLVGKNVFNFISLIGPF